MTHRIVIAGAGGIGRAVGLLLAEWGEDDVEVRIGDALPERAREAAEWIRAGASPSADRSWTVEPFTMPAERSDEELERALSDADALLDCLPGDQSVRMARLALDHGLGYANLTEYVEESREITELAANAERGFVLQTGLAPGFVDVLGRKLYLEFRARHGVDRVESLRLRVGALPVRALPPHYYGFTWSPAGVATEYIEPSVVLRDGEITNLPSLSEIETVRLGDLTLEEALTSGGAADLPERFAGCVRDLDYKTFRHPGHWTWVQETIDRLSSGGAEAGSKALIAALQDEMLRAVPHVDDDQVVVYAAVEGYDRAGVRRRIDELLVIRPRTVGRHRLKAIQHTTAAALAESVRMLLADGLSGVVLQSAIEPERWLAGPYVRKSYYGEG